MASEGSIDARAIAVGAYEADAHRRRGREGCAGRTRARGAASAFVTGGDEKGTERTDIELDSLLARDGGAVLGGGLHGEGGALLAGREHAGSGEADEAALRDSADAVSHHGRSRHGNADGGRGGCARGGRHGGLGDNHASGGEGERSHLPTRHVVLDGYSECIAEVGLQCEEDLGKTYSRAPGSQGHVDANPDNDTYSSLPYTPVYFNELLNCIFS